VRYFTAIVLILLCSACTTTASRITPEAITGDWISSEQLPDQRLADTRMYIRADGTFSGELQINTETVWAFAGRWTLNGNAITWEYTDSSLVLLIDDQSEVDTILQLNDREMQLRSSRHDTVRTLRRIE
jgi:hypothetical protein